MTETLPIKDHHERDRADIERQLERYEHECSEVISYQLEEG